MPLGDKKQFIDAEKKMKEVSERDIKLGNRTDEEILKNAGNVGMIFEYGTKDKRNLLQLEVLLDIRRELKKLNLDKDVEVVEK